MPAPSPNAQTPPEPAILPPGLVYVTDAMPGHRRVRRGSGFAYLDRHGHRLSDAAELARIRALAIPPAYRDVWICPLPNGHLQATGRDARGRKQYRYHRDWSAGRGDHKFSRLEAFARALPRIRARVAADLRAASPGARLGRRTLLAALVRLLDTTFVRVGNESYARENGSYGLTTLKAGHASLRGQTLRLRFVGKSGVQHEVSVEDRRIAAIVRRCQRLPGQELFRYEDESGTARALDSGEVNDYLAEVAGERFTAKDFRTWHGSVQALELLREAHAREGPPSTKTAALAMAAQAVRSVAQTLGNTAAVCRSAYIHPGVLALVAPSAAEGSVAPFDWTQLESAGTRTRGLQAPERRLARLLALLRRRAARPNVRQRSAAPRSGRKKTRGTSIASPGRFALEQSA